MKLYVIGRQDLSIEMQGVQNAHAAINFIFEHPEISKNWNTYSNYLVFLSIQDEYHLNTLLEKANVRGIKTTSFYEPDRDNELTAIALEPSVISKKLVSSLPLMRKGVLSCL